MDPEPDVIRQEIEKTRSSLTDKLSTLEEQVKETVSSVTHTVEETIETVKEKVQGTVDTVKRTFDLPYQTERHPWAMTGGSALLGLLLGYSLGGRSRRRPQEPRYRPVEPAWDEGLRRDYKSASPAGYEAAAEYVPPPPPPRRQERSFLSSLLKPFAAEIDKVKEVAVSSLMGMVRDSVVRAVPPGLAPQVEEILNDLTYRLGGKPVQGPILPEQDRPERPVHQHNGH